MPAHGSVFLQSLELGLTQILVSFGVNLVIVLGAAKAAIWLNNNPLWIAVQRYFMGFVLFALAMKLAFQDRALR